MTGHQRPRRSADRRHPPFPIDIRVEGGDWPRRSRLRQIVADAVGAAAMLSGAELAADCELSIVFTYDDHIRELNRLFRGTDKPTNVLSFPAVADDGGMGLPSLLGDIVLAQETVAAEAADQGLTFDHHLTHLIVHGFLHLLGHDHETEAEALVMERLETAILGGMGIADPYRDSDED